MGKKKRNATLEGIIGAINNYSTPAAITSQVVANVITSKKTKEIVRQVLIDPIQSALVPRINAVGYDKCIEVFNALINIFDDKRLSEILDVTEAKCKEYREMLSKEHPRYPFSSYRYELEEMKGGLSTLFRYKNAIVYLTAQTAIYAGRGNAMDGQFRITLEFISPTHSVYEEFEEKVEAARQYLEKGYYEQFERRIKIIRSGRRGFQVSYATVPITIVIERDIRDKVEGVINAVNKSDEIKDLFEVNKTIGVLLWGPPGTGKSTIVRYLAMRLGRTLILTTADNLSEVIDYTKERSNSDNKYIILIEDIDFKFADRRKLMESAKKKKPVKEPVPEVDTSAEDDDDDDDDEEDMMPARTNPFALSQTDTLFQLLDGVLGDSKIMVCATTNYKDRLDPALIREGRFDHDIYVAGLSMEDAREVCEKFNISPSDINLDTFSVPVNAASLQTAILNFKTSGKVSKSNETAKSENEDSTSV